MVGRNLISVVLTDLVNILLDPSWATVLSSLVDLSSFFFMPMVGGYTNATVYANYIKDPLTYQHAGLDQD